MSVITSGKTFANGEQLSADKLNQVITAATFNSSDAVDGSTITLVGGAMAVAESGISTTKIANSNVTKAKIENVANMKALGNTSGSATSPQEVAILDEDTMSSDSATSLATQQSIKAYVNSITIGVNQTWQDMSSSRAASTSYQNTTGKPIMVAIKDASLSAGKVAAVSSDNSTFITIGSQGAAENSHFYFIVPNNHYYKYTGAFAIWCELR